MTNSWRQILSWEEKGDIHYKDYTPLGSFSTSVFNYGGYCENTEEYENVPPKKLKNIIAVTDDWKFVTCPKCKELKRDNKLQDKLLTEHDKEAKRHHAEFYNYGAGQGWFEFYSKTSEGGLESHIDPQTGVVTHEWID